MRLSQLHRRFVITFFGGLLFMTTIQLLTTIQLRFSILKTTFSRAKASMDDLPPLLSLTIEKAAEGLNSGKFTSVDLVKAYLARIEEALDFKTVLQVNLDAVASAQQLDEERSRSGSRGPLHGIPILVKDNIVTKDNLHASAGSFTLLGAKPEVESSVISKLRQAGVVILGKTNMSEWANFRGQNISAGWSPRGGQTLGTYYPHSRSDGSSSGSAAAAALGLCAAALGTETWGSIVDPAEIHNVVGLKPSRGLIGADAVVPISKGQDVIGTLTRTVADAAFLLNTMAGRSEADDKTWHIPEPLPDFTSFCKSTDLSGITIGIPRGCFKSTTSAALMASFESAMNILASAGAKVVDNANLPDVEGFLKLSSEERGFVRTADFKRDIVAYLQTLKTNPNNIHTLEDIVNFTKTFYTEGYPEQDIGNFLFAQSKEIEVSSESYKRHVDQENYFGGEGGIVGALEKYKLDILVVPSTLGVITDLASKMGFPLISVPLGFHPEGTPVEVEDKKEGLVSVAPGIPYGMTFATKAFSDGKLLQVAYAFEQLSGVRANGPMPFKAPNTELRDVSMKAQKI